MPLTRRVLRLVPLIEQGSTTGRTNGTNIAHLAANSADNLERRQNYRGKMSNQETIQHVSMIKFSCTSFIFANGTDILPMAIIGCQYCSGFYGRQWYQRQNHQCCCWEKPECSLTYAGPKLIFMPPTSNIRLSITLVYSQELFEIYRESMNNIKADPYIFFLLVRLVAVVSLFRLVDCKPMEPCEQNIWIAWTWIMIVCLQIVLKV